MVILCLAGSTDRHYGDLLAGYVYVNLKPLDVVNTVHIKEIFSHIVTKQIGLGVLDTD